MKIDEILAVATTLNEMLLSLDQSDTPERRKAAGRYAELTRFLSSEIGRRIALLESGQRYEATQYCRGETPVPELAAQMRLCNEKRYRELCRCYDWPQPLSLDMDQAQLLAEAGACGISLRDLLNSWRNGAARMAPAEKMDLLRRIRQLDPAHEEHWLRIFPEVEKSYCAELARQVADCDDEPTLAAIAKEVLTTEWVSPAAAEIRTAVVAKLRAIQLAAGRRRLQEELDRLADCASRRDRSGLADALKELEILMSDPDCRLSDAETLQLEEAQKLSLELARAEETAERIHGLTDRINAALDEGSSYSVIAEDFRTLRESGAVIDPLLADRVGTARNAQFQEERARLRRRWSFTIVAAAAILLLVVWIVFLIRSEKRLAECAAVTAEYLQTDRPHDADAVMARFLKRDPGAADRDTISLRRTEIRNALNAAAARADRFDREVAALEEPPKKGEEPLFYKRFRAREKELGKLPAADDALRLQRLAALRDRAAREEEESLHRRERETRQLCDRWLLELRAPDLPEEKLNRIAAEAARRKCPDPPLTVLEKEMLEAFCKELSTLQASRKAEKELRLLLERLPKSADADSYLKDRETLSHSAYRQGPAAAWCATDEYLPLWKKVSSFRFNRAAFTKDREADAFLELLRQTLQAKALNQTLERLFPADKLAGKPYLTAFRELLKKWEKELTEEKGKELYEFVLIDSQRNAWRLFSRGAFHIERAKRGFQQPVALQIEALVSPETAKTERLTFRWEKAKGRSGQPALVRVAQSASSESFREMPLRFQAVGGVTDPMQLVPQRAVHLRLAKEAVANLSKCSTRDEAAALLGSLLTEVSGMADMEPSLKAKLILRLLQLLASVEPMAQASADKMAADLARALPADWNWCDPACRFRQPRVAKELAALSEPGAVAAQLKEVQTGRDLERLAMIRFPRPAGIVLAQDAGGTTLHLFGYTHPDAELWSLSESADGRIFFRIVKEHGAAWRHSPKIPHGTLLFTPADESPTPAVDLRRILPQCWPSRENAR